jgi:DNA polymerase-3 subunit epsilon
MREIVFDTETTGLDPSQGHRLIEIGCIELVNRFPTGRTFHRYINPERDIPPEAFNVHGISLERVQNEKVFAEIADEFLEFLGDAALVAHNAMFDLGFLNFELERAQRPILNRERLIDTLTIARRKFPAGPNRLDDLCVRFRIDNSHRTKHGALLDAELLAEVYIELIGARQALLGLADGEGEIVQGAHVVASWPRPVPLPPRLSDAEQEAHRSFVAALGDAAVWRDYL